VLERDSEEEETESGRERTESEREKEHRKHAKERSERHRTKEKERSTRDKESDRDRPSRDRETRDRSSKEKESSRLEKKASELLQKSSKLDRTVSSSSAKKVSKAPSAVEAKPIAISAFDEMPIKPLAANSEALKVWTELAKSDAKKTDAKKLDVVEAKQPSRPSSATIKPAPPSEPKPTTPTDISIPKVAPKPVISLPSPVATPPAPPNLPTETPTEVIPLVPCPHCSRKFHPDRLQPHASVCLSSSNSKRKKFDSKGMRIGELAKEGVISEAEKQRREKEAEEKLKKRKGGWKKKHGRQNFCATMKLQTMLTSPFGIRTTCCFDPICTFAVAILFLVSNLSGPSQKRRAPAHFRDNLFGARG
jgi:hypothetical protein